MPLTFEGGDPHPGSTRKGTIALQADSTREGRSAMSKRELIEPTPGDKRYVRRDAQGQFDSQVDVGKSLAADQRQHAKTKASKGEGDKGDR
jgi:hypothetical protein